MEQDVKLSEKAKSQAIQDVFNLPDDINKKPTHSKQKSVIEMFDEIKLKQ